MKKIFNRLFSGGSQDLPNPAPITLPSFYLSDRYPQYSIGIGTYGPLQVKHWGESSRLEIGSYCSFASGTQVLLGGEHRSDWITTYPFGELWEESAPVSGHPKSKGDVDIGSDVWVGTDALILSGISIGHGAIIGARAVVTKSVPPYAIVVGNPARVIRKRFDDEVIAQLTEIAWWNWSRERISRALPLLQNSHVTEFISLAKAGSL